MGRTSAGARVDAAAAKSRGALLPLLLALTKARWKAEERDTISGSRSRSREGRIGGSLTGPAWPACLWMHGISVCGCGVSIELSHCVDGGGGQTNGKKPLWG